MVSHLRKEAETSLTELGAWTRRKGTGRSGLTASAGLGHAGCAISDIVLGVLVVVVSEKTRHIDGWFIFVGLGIFWVLVFFVVDD